MKITAGCEEMDRNLVASALLWGCEISWDQRRERIDDVVLALQSKLQNDENGFHR